MTDPQLKKFAKLETVEQQKEAVDNINNNAPNSPPPTDPATNIELEEQGGGKNGGNGGQNGVSMEENKVNSKVNGDNGKEIGLSNPGFESPGSPDSWNQRARHLSTFSDSNLSFPGQIEEDPTDEYVTLMFTRHEQIPLRDFSAEHRGISDVENFLQQSHIILDLNESNLDKIMDDMLRTILDKEEIPTTIEDAKAAIFTNDNARQLCKTIQGTCKTYGGGVDYDQSWICILSALPNVQKRHVCVARLKHPANLGRTSQEVYFVILVVAPTKEKGTKNAMETGRTFATMFSDMELRGKLLAESTEEGFKELLRKQSKELAADQKKHDMRKFSYVAPGQNVEFEEASLAKRCCFFGRGIACDFKRRIKFYASDFKDGFVGHRTIQKTISTTLFLYFACLLPCIALGVLNDKNTKHNIGVKEVLYSQTIGGIFFALFGGQPMVILLTTAPLALYTKVIYNISSDMNVEFLSLYACTGLWNSFFLILYSVLGASKLMKWSTEEIFALFISIAFTVDCCKDVVGDFNKNYDTAACEQDYNFSSFSCNVSDNSSSVDIDDVNSWMPCERDKSLLFLLLVLGTVWLGLLLFNFTKTPFLKTTQREMLADYALPVAVLFMSFFGSFVFKDVDLKPFSYQDQAVFKQTHLDQLTVSAVFVGMGLGFCLSLLFFMDQNISAAMVSSPDNKLKKGTAYHWDLLVIAVLNAVLTVFGLPMMHGALPHSPLHVRAMADMQDRVDDGHVHQTILHVRENRVTALFSHILIGLSILMLPVPLSYIPRAVLDGLFLYLAATALTNNQMFERVLLLITEQAAYPPNHYVRHVPQRKVHLFTFFQMVQLGVMCAFGFSPIPYMKMCFPVLILLLLPIRHKLVPLAISRKHLKFIDGHGAT